MGCLRRGMLEIWHVRDAESLWSGKLGIPDVEDVECCECEMLRM